MGDKSNREYILFKSVISLLTFFLFTIPLNSFASVYVPHPEFTINDSEPSKQFIASGLNSIGEWNSQNPKGYDYKLRLAMACSFLERMQVADTESEDFGGIKEGEKLQTIIQSDNTHEAVWVWSRYRVLTGSGIYDDNVDAAFSYLMKNPCYLEEGGTGPDGYYRVYNSAWALSAVSEYFKATGDTTYSVYADTAAKYISFNRLALDRESPLNGMVEAWAAGNLMLYGFFTGNQSFIDSAFSIGCSVKEWVEDEPEERLAAASWAFSSGAILWGLANSYFVEKPWESQGWLEDYGEYVADRADTASWSNAWNGWYALGHFSLWKLSGNFSYKWIHDSLTEMLMSQDTELDGGIPASETDECSSDQSWVTSYLCFMGMDELISRASVSARPTEWLLHHGDDAGIHIDMVSNREYPAVCAFDVNLFLPGGNPYPDNPIYGPSEVEFPGLGEFSVFRGGLIIPSNIPIGKYEIIIRCLDEVQTGAATDSSIVKVEIEE